MTQDNNNLIPMSERTKDEQKVIATMGGKASGEARRQKKLMKEQMQILLSLPCKKQKNNNQMKALGIEGEELDNQMAVIVAMWEKALKGNVKAAEFLRDTLGENAPEKIEIEGNVPVVLAGDDELDD